MRSLLPSFPPSLIGQQPVIRHRLQTSNCRRLHRPVQLFPSELDVIRIRPGLRVFATLGDPKLTDAPCAQPNPHIPFSAAHPPPNSNVNLITVLRRKRASEERRASDLKGRRNSVSQKMSFKIVTVATDYAAAAALSSPACRGLAKECRKRLRESAI